jgi:hypothetical protein
MNFKQFTLPTLLTLMLVINPVVSASTELLQKTTADSTSNTQEVKKPLTNRDIIDMVVQDGFGENIILAAIEANESQFDVSREGLRQLKNAGVSQKIIEAMLAAGARKRTSPSSSELSPTSNGIVPSAMASQPSTSQQPYALLVQGEAKQKLALAPTRIAQVKTKGQDLASLAADGAVNGVLTQAAAEAAAQAAVSVAVATGSSIITAGVLGGMMEPLTRVLVRSWRKPTATYVWALPGRNASAVLQTNMPKFEIFYGDIVGVDPDEFQPAIIRLEQTGNNWRLAGATKAKLDVDQVAAPEWEVYSSFVEQPVPARVSKLGRGHLLIESEKPLDLGEYGLVLRPLSRRKKFSGTDVASGQGEGLVFNSAWDFSVSLKSEGQ